MFESYRRSEPEISLSALVDVLFILVVFVMLAANFEQARAIDLTLPAGGALPEPTKEQPVVVTVPARGPVRVDQREVASDQLETHLRELRAQKSRLVLSADRGLPLERATEILSMAQNAGFTAVSIATRARGAGDEPEQSGAGEGAGEDHR
jgi:biopolymer transport protein ExbD